MKEFPSELRFDLVSKDWVIIAKKRRKVAKFLMLKRKKTRVSKKKCPFCNLKEKPILAFFKGKKLKRNEIPKNWTTIVLKNKYPALLPAKKLKKEREGKFYGKLLGIGFCELVITRDHQKNFAEFEISQIKEVLDCYQLRYLELMKNPFVNYISIFQNFREEAGASQPHPHSQIITTPLIDADLQKALLNSKIYYQKTKKCIYCQMNKWEEKVKKRIVFENSEFLVLCPFASKTAFEMIISPKKHSSNFELIKEEEKWKLAEAFKQAMQRLSKVLKNPPFNFYLHTAPADGKKYPFYHWHFTILPKTSNLAGFELGTKIEICTFPPEEAAKILRKVQKT